MLDQYLRVAYESTQTKVAHRELIDQLKTLPLEELIKAANGDPTSKLTYTDGPSDGQWIDKYKGTPLFEKAIELEKQLLQIDMQENQEHAARRAEEKAEEPRTNFYDQRDALKLQQRMLDLELATSQESGSNPEAKEEQGAQLIEQAQAQETAEGKGNEPHEQAETAALNQFRQAQQQEAVEAPKTASALHNAAKGIKGYAKALGGKEHDKLRAAALGHHLADVFGRADAKIQRDPKMGRVLKIRAMGHDVRNLSPEGIEASADRHAHASKKLHGLADKAADNTSRARKGTARVAGALGGAGIAAAAVSHHKNKEKTAGSIVNSIVPETRSLGRTPAGDHAQGAGAGEVFSDPSATVTEGLQVNKTASVASAASRFKELATGSKARKLEETASNWGRAANLSGKHPAVAGAGKAAERYGKAARTERLKSLGTQAASAGGAVAAGAGVKHLARKEKTATPYDDYLKTELNQRGHEQKAKSQEAHPTRTRILGALSEGARVGIPLGLGSAGGALLMTRNPRFALEQGMKGLAIGGGLGALGGSMQTPGELDRNMASMYGDALTPDSLREDAKSSRELGDHIDKHPTQIRAARGIGFGAAGALGGRLIGGALGHPDLGTAIGAGGGALLGALPKPSGKGAHQDAAEIEKYMQTRGIPTEKQAGIGSSIIQAGQSALTAGKGMLANAGGLSGLGSKAMGFAKANPLATAGIAGGAGLLAGKALARPQQQKVAAVDIRKALQGAKQLPFRVKTLATEAYRKGGVPEVIGTFEDKGMGALQGASSKLESAKKKFHALATEYNPYI